MTQNDGPGVNLDRALETAKREVKPWVEPAARVGHAAKGIVFILTGVLVAATQLALTPDVEGPEGAFATLRHAPLGKVMVGTIGVGLLYYAAWEVLRTIADPEHEARGRVLPRLEWFIGAVVFGFVSVAAFRVAFARTVTAGDEAARTWASRVMTDVPLGGSVLGLAGALIMIGGAILIRRGWRADFDRSINLTGFSPNSWAATYVIARVGIVARGIVVSIIGVFLVFAAWKHDATEAIGIEGAFRILGRQPPGPWLVTAVALGFATYGIYEVLIAWRGRFYID